MLWLFGSLQLANSTNEYRWTEKPSRSLCTKTLLRPHQFLNTQNLHLPLFRSGFPFIRFVSVDFQLHLPVHHSLPLNSSFLEKFCIFFVCLGKILLLSDRNLMGFQSCFCYMKIRAKSDWIFGFRACGLRLGLLGTSLQLKGCGFNYSKNCWLGFGFDFYEQLRIKFSSFFGPVLVTWDLEDLWLCRNILL